jgi:hypothetical protein
MTMSSSNSHGLSNYSGHKNDHYHHAYQILNYVSRYFLSATVFMVAATLPSLLPQAGLDESWMFGLNQALAQGLTFGQDVIFNVGPYLSIFTQHYHPDLEIIAIYSHLYFGVCYAILVYIAARKASISWIIALSVVFAADTYERDVLLMLYPLILAIMVFVILRKKDDQQAYEILTRDKLFIVILYSPLGLLPIVKGSFLITSFATIIITAILFLYTKNGRLAVYAFLSPLVTMILLWWAAGQRLSALPDYFFSMISVISGYSESMALNGNIFEDIAYVAVGIGVLYVVIRKPKAAFIFRIFLCAAFGLFLFVAFKDGFIRHGKHVLIGGSSITAAAVAMALVARSRLNGVIAILALATTIYVHQGFINSWRELGYGHFAKSYSDFYHGFEARLDGSLLKAYRTSLDGIQSELPLPKLSGSTDIYSYGQSYLLASKNEWTPRPVIQGHEAYTPSLERANLDFLLGPHAPDNIVFRVETIDDRLPSLEDGPSWPILLTAYIPQRVENDYLFLRKSNAAKDLFESETVTGNSSLGVRYLAPAINGGAEVVFAQIALRQSLIGRISSLLYKPKLLYISLELADGSKRSYRIPSGLAGAGFLLSPVIEKTREFALLFGDRGFLSEKEVKSFEVDTPGMGRLFWQDDYTVKFWKMAPNPAPNASYASPFDPFVDDAKIIDDYGHAASIECEGSIDAINADAQASKITHIDRTLSASGWTTVSGKDGKLPDDVFITLTDEGGQTRLLKARRASRADLAAFFDRPETRLAGFEAYADVTALKGKFTVGIARMNAGRIETCKQQKRGVSIGGLNAENEGANPTKEIVLAEPTKCIANIDRINGAPVSRDSAIAADNLSIGGWMVISPSEGIAPDKVFVTLKQENGVTERVGATKISRPDISAHFNNPNLDNAGFLANVDTSSLKGNVTLGLAREYAGKVQECSGFAVSIEVRPNP